MSISVKPHRNAADRRSEQGTVFLVMVAVVALMGALMILGVGVFHTVDNADLVRKTSLRQAFLVHELAAYAQRTDTLPCPADPTISPTAAGFGFSRASTPATPCGGLFEGILPFRTLNLSQNDAVDGWDRYMTYAISRVLADTTPGDAAVGGANPNIFMRCRREPWFQDDDASSPVNEYPQKALFCCPPSSAGSYLPATDLKVYASSALLAAGTPIDSIGRQAANASYYHPLNSEVSSADVPGDTQGGLAPIPDGVSNEDLFAFVLVSHGQNGIGAYAVGTTGRVGTPSAAGTDEQVNIHTTAGTNYIDRPINTVPGANYYDDIVVWRTQLTLMSELDNASCYIPWR